MRRIAQIALTIVTFGAAGIVGALLADDPSVQAQDIRFDAKDSVARYTRRYVIPAIAAPGIARASGVVRVTNYGFEPTNIAIIELDAPGSVPPGGCSSPGGIASSRCVTDIAPNATVEVDLAGMGRGSLVIYSLDPNAAASCGRLVAVADGRVTLESWETETWHGALGERIAVMADLAQGSDHAMIAGIPSSGLGAQLRGLNALSYAPSTAGWEPDSPVHIVNMAAECLTVRAATVPASDGSLCEPPSFATIELPAFSAGEITHGDGVPNGLTLVARGEAIAATSLRDGGGWTNAQVKDLAGTTTSGQIAFPMAVGPLDDAQTTLWVSNHHPTATAQIDILMWDGNRSLRVPFADDLPLCAGATRSYDITALAGEIPGTTGRGDATGPPLLSLRVESTGYGIKIAPPIAARLEIQSDAGKAAYSGLRFPPIMGIAARVAAGSDRPVRGQARGISVVPGIMVNFGPERRTTVLALQTLDANPMAERQARINFYDLSGRLVAENIAVQIGIGPAGFIDLGTLAGRLGDAGRAGFVGTAVIRGNQNRGTVGAVALTRSTLAGDSGVGGAAGDGLTLHRETSSSSRQIPICRPPRRARQELFLHRRPHQRL